MNPRAIWLLAAAALLAGCQEDLKTESETFVCESPDDCLEGYGCAPEADDAEVSICLECRGASWPDACRSCMEEACCAESRACGESVTCHDERTCRVACAGDESCEDNCVTLSRTSCCGKHCRSRRAARRW